MEQDYFNSYLKISPLPLALWRGPETSIISQTQFHQPILDIGCGFGEFAQVFFPNPPFIGIDIQSRDLHIAQNNNSYQFLSQSDGRHLPFQNNSFQTILAMSVLEHIAEPELVISEAFRVLKPGGKLVFSVPTSRINQHLHIAKLGNYLHLPALSNLYIKLFHQVFQHKVIKPKRWWLTQVTNTGFHSVNHHPALTLNQLKWFELTLPLAIFSQFSRLTTGKRLPNHSKLRTKIINRLFKNIHSQTDYTDINIIITCQK